MCGFKEWVHNFSTISLDTDGPPDPFVRHEQPFSSPVGRSCRIHWLHLFRRVRPSNKCPGYDTKQSNGNAGVLGNADIGLYTPINYFGRYATCSHKDGGRSHIQSRETIGQEDHVTGLKLRPHVSSSPVFWATDKMHIFYKYVIFKHPCSLLHKFFAAATHSLQRESTGEKSNNMDGPHRHSKYTLTMRRFPVSEKLPVSNHKKSTF